MEPEVFYRYEDYMVSIPDSYSEDEYYTSSSRVRLLELPVIKKTHCGVWLNLGFDVKRFVLLKSRKRYACPTKDEAAASFVARKNKQMRFLHAKIKHIEHALGLLESR